MDISRRESIPAQNKVDFRQATSAWDIVCTGAAGIEPVLNKTICQNMASQLSRCDTLLDACDNYKDDLICELAAGFCFKQIAFPYIKTGRNPYDGQFRANLAHCSFRAMQRSRQFMFPNHGKSGEIPEPKGHSTQTGGKFISRPGFCCLQRKSGGSILQEERRIDVHNIRSDLPPQQRHPCPHLRRRIRLDLVPSLT